MIDTMNCGLCLNPMAQDDKKIQFLCECEFHTICFFRRSITIEYIQDVRCSNCNERVVPREIVEEFQAIHGNEGRHEIIQQMWAENEEFRNDLCNAQKQMVIRNKIHAKLKNKVKEIYTEFKKKTSIYIDMLKTFVTNATKNVKSLVEYKETTKMTNKYIRMIQNIRRKWGVNTYDMIRALENNNETRLIVPPILWRFRNKGEDILKFRIRIK